MSWVDGLRRLGIDTWFVEELSPAAWGPATPDAVTWFRTVVDRFGLNDRAILFDADTSDVLAGPRVAVDGDLLINISGHTRCAALLGSCRRRAYVDVDPGYTQIWHAQGLDLGLDEHDTHFTVGQNVGRPGCPVPDAGMSWLAVLPPVVLDEWPVQPEGAAERFTTIASWRGGYGTVEFNGASHGPKAHQFRKFVDLPRRVPAVLELALDIHPGDDADQRLLVEHGWRLVDPSLVSGDVDRFRSYIQGSDGEFSVAQGVYVDSRTGWFSDRTACYLASGRPALVQDTGIGNATADGLVSFATMSEAVEGFADISSRYGEHCAAARRFAERHLDSTTVLTRVLEQAGVS